LTNLYSADLNFALYAYFLKYFSHGEKLFAHALSIANVC